MPMLPLIFRLTLTCSNRPICSGPASVRRSEIARRGYSGSTFPQSRKIVAEILAGVPDDEQAKIAGGNTARVYHFDIARLMALT